MLRITIGSRSVLPTLMAVSVAFVGAMVLRDLTTAMREGYRFYLSESLLFSTVWLYFLPVALLVRSRLAGDELKALPRYLRYVVAVVIAVALHASLYAAGVYLMSLCFFDHHYAFTGNLGYTLSSDLLIYILVYSGLAFLHWWKEPKKVLPALPSMEKLTVVDGRVTSILDVSEILFIQSADPYISIHVAGKKYLHKASLRSMEEQLGQQFVRVHRSAIVNTGKVKEVNSRGNGDFDLVLDGRQILRLSRNYVQGFRRRMGIGYSA